MARQFYYPFKKHSDEVSTEKNRTAIEEFLNALEFNDQGPIGGGDHLDGSGPPGAGLGRDGDMYFDTPNGDIWYKDPVNGWELWFEGMTEDQINALVEARVRWRNIWVQQLYEQNDMVRDGAYAMIANKQTQDKAAPVPVSGRTWLMPDNPIWTELEFTGSVYSGIRLTPPTGRFFQLSEYRAWIDDVSPNAHYQIVILDLITGLFSVSTVFDGDILAVPGWLTIPIDPLFISGGDDFIVGLLTNNSAGTTDFNHPWVYTGTSQLGDPGVGNTNRTNQHDLIRINNIDDDAVDRTAELSIVTIDTTIKVQSEGNVNEFFEYVVTGIIDQGTYHEYVVSLLDTGLAGPGIGVRCQVYFEVPVALPAQYVQLPNHWTGNPDLQGYISFDSITGGTLDEHGYSMDVRLQEFAASEDWDLVAVSGGSGGGGDGEGGTSLQQLEAWPTGPTHLDAAYSILGNTLTVPAGRGVIMDSWTDPENIPVVVAVAWSETAIDFGLVTTRHTSFVYIDSAGTVQFDIVSPDPALVRSRLYLGRAFHNTADGTLGENFRPWHPIPNAVSQTLYDFILAVGGAFLFKGAEVDPNIDLTFNTNDQQWFSPGESWQQDPDDPNIGNNPGFSPQPFTYVISDNTQPGGDVTLVDPTSWESPLGTIASVGVNPNTATIQRLYALISGQYVMAYGQTEYPTLEDAILGLSSDIQNFVPPDYIEDENQIALVAYFIMSRSTTDLQDGTDVVIINDERLPLGGGGSAAHSHDATYLKLSGGTMTGAINMAGQTLHGLPSPPPLGDAAVSLDYLNTQAYVPFAGGTMLGFLSLFADPTAVLHAATKQYVDAADTEHIISTLAPGSPSLGDVWVDPDGLPEETYLPLTGGTMTGQILGATGSAAAPGYSFDGDPDTGFYRDGANKLGFATGGAARFFMDTGYMWADGPTGTPALRAGVGDAASPAHTFNGDLDTGMYWAGTNQLGFARNGIRALHLSTTHANFGIGTTGMPTAYTGGAGTALLPAWSFTGDTNTGMYRGAADNLAVATGGSRRLFWNGNGTHISTLETTGSAANVFANTGASNRLQRSTSARRYKSAIHDDPTLADLTLEPVRFHHDGDDKDYIGFIADDMPTEDAIVRHDNEVENYDLRAIVAILAAKVNRLEATNG